MRSRHRLPIDGLTPYLIPDAPRGESTPLINWRELFGNDHPVEIEVGFGKGLFLLNASAARPDINFFGIEIMRMCQLHTATQMAKANRANVKLACADACVFLGKSVPPATVHGVHVYFPDPWWKRRHKKRRLFTAEFVSHVADVLRPDGFFHIVTDVEEYFEVMMRIMRDQPTFESISPPQPTEARDDHDYLTNFERKFRKQGKPIYRAAFAKRIS